MSGSWSLFYTLSFSSIQGKEICRIDVRPAPEAVYTQNGGEFYVREGSMKRKLSPLETVDYRGKRWP